MLFSCHTRNVLDNDRVLRYKSLPFVLMACKLRACGYCTLGVFNRRILYMWVEFDNIKKLLLPSLMADNEMMTNLLLLQPDQE